MNRWRGTYWLLLMLVFSVSAEAQFDLSGTIVDAATGAALSKVEVFDDVSGAIVFSDADGRFKFEKLKKGVHSFTFFNPDYNALVETINLQENIEIEVALKKLNVTLSSVEIAARRSELFSIKQLADVEGTSIFAGKKTEVLILDSIFAFKAANLGRQIYAQIPGLNIYEGSDGGLQLNIGGRGLDPNRTSNFNTRQNGYEISADALGYPESYYTPPSEAVETIRIVRGAGSLQYGSQFGGLLDFRLKKIPLSKPIDIVSNQTIGSFGFFNTFNAIGFNKNGFSINAFYNYKTGNGYRSNSEFDSSNIFFNLAYRPNANWNFNLEYTFFDYLAKQAGGLTDEQFDLDPRQSTRARNWFDVNWNLASLRIDHIFSESLTSSLAINGMLASRKSVGYRGNPILLNENPITSLDEQNQAGDFISYRDLIVGNFRNLSGEFRIIKNYQLKNRDAVLLFGTKLYRSQNTSQQGPGSRGIDPDFNFFTQENPDYPNQSDFTFPNFNAAIFLEQIVYLNPKLSITPGARVEYIRTQTQGDFQQVIFDNAGNAIGNFLFNEQDTFDRAFALFGIGLSYKKSERFNLIANISQNYRSVTFSDIRVVSPSFIVDPEISDERGATADIGIKGKINKFFYYDLTAYSILYDDKIGIILDERANRVRKNIGTAIIAGTESLLSLNVAKMMSTGIPKYKFEFFVNAAFTYSQYIDSEENNVIGKQVEFIPSTNLKSGLVLGLHKAKASLQYSYVAQQFTDGENSLRTVAGDSRSGMIGEIPAYSILDLSFKYDFSKFNLTAGINNLLDENYYTRRATGYPGPGIIPSEGRSYFVSLGFHL